MFQSILLIDDHAAILEGLKTLLMTRYPGAVLRGVSSSAEARWLLAREQPDLVILDLSIGKESGLDFIEHIRDSAAGARIVVYSLHQENQFVVTALRKGAHAYITKDRPIAELMEALRRVETGRRYIGLDQAETLAEAMAKGEKEEETRRLSKREAQILKMLARGRAAKEIAGELGLSEKTVSTYRARMLDKLGLSTTADLIRYAVDQKW